MRSMLIASLLAALGAPALAADPVQGEWLVEGGSAKVRIAPCAHDAARMCGLISWVRDPREAAATDERNPDPKLKTRPIMGLPLIRDFRPRGPGAWTGGKIYDPNSGKTYDSKLQVNADGTLRVDGCVLMVCRKQTWRRAS